jgi:hypothetical protein
MTSAQLHFAHKANALQLVGADDMARTVYNLFVTRADCGTRHAAAKTCETAANVKCGADVRRGSLFLPVKPGNLRPCIVTPT